MPLNTRQFLLVAFREVNLLLKESNIPEALCERCQLYDNCKLYWKAPEC
jgi:hypothetical protein